MGSFNTTCFASNQTIAPDDACYVIALRQNNSYQPIDASYLGKQVEIYGVTPSTCYAHAFWEPISPFLPAKYYDYGQVILDMTPQTRKHLLDLFLHLHQRSGQVAEGKNEVHDLPFDFPKFAEDNAPAIHLLGTRADLFLKTSFPDDVLDKQLLACWEYMWDVAMHKQRVFVGNHSGRLRQFSFAIIHAHAYEQLIADVAAGTDWDDLTLEPRAFFDRALAAGEQSAKESEADIGQVASADLTDTQREALQQVHRISAYSSAFRDYIRRVGSGSNMSFGWDTQVTSTLLQAYALGKLDADTFFARYKPILDLRYVIQGLELYNLKIQPMVYACQDYSNEMGQKYAAFVNQVSAKVTADREREYL